MIKVKNQFINIDVFRIFLAVLVISIHSIVTDYDVEFYLKSGIARWAVPMFFMMIGMQLSFEKLTDKDFIKKYSKSQANIFLPWISFFMVISLFDILNSNSIEYVLGFFVPFWFVLASCFSLIYIHLLLKFLKFKYIFIISIILHIFGIFGDAYYRVIESIPLIGDFYTGFLSIFITSRWGFSFGLFYICLGIILSKQDFLRLKPIYNLSIFIVCILLQFLELSFLRTTNAYDYNMYFSLIPISILLFNFIKRHSYSKKGSIDYKRISVYIFCTHTLLIYLVTTIEDIYGIRSSFVEVLLAYLFIAPLFLLFSFLSKKVKIPEFAHKYWNYLCQCKTKILLIVSTIVFIISIIFFDRGDDTLQWGLLISLLFFSYALSVNIEVLYKRTLKFILLLVCGTVLLMSSDYLLLKHFKLIPVYVIDITITEDTTFYNTLFYEAYISNKEDLPVHFESIKEFGAETYEYIENFDWTIYIEQ